MGIEDQSGVHITARSGGGGAQLRAALKTASRVVVVVLGLALITFGASSLGTLAWPVGLPLVGFGMTLVAIGLAHAGWGNVVVGSVFAVFGAGCGHRRLASVRRHWAREQRRSS